MRNQDGFEVFYGVSKAAPPAKPQKTTVPERDGFDIFFGIQTRGRNYASRETPRMMSARNLASSGAPQVRVQHQQVESQLQARLARPVPSPDLTSRVVPISRSVSDGPVFQYALGSGDAPAEPTMAQVAQADVSRIPIVREDEEEEKGHPTECVNLGEEPSAPSLSQSWSQPPEGSSQARLVKGLEVFSMCGRPTPGLVPAGVVAFDLATPTPSFEPSSAATKNA